MINKDEIILITPERGFLYHGPKSEGYKIFAPYIDRSLIGRILREICFRCPLLPRKVWYNKEFLCCQPKYVIVSDTLVTREYLEWLHKKFPAAQLNFSYGNMVGKSRHLLPDQIPSYYRIWTYDGYDSEKYGLRLVSSGAYYKSFVKPKQQSEYDVIYVGADKGRGEYILDLEKKMNSLGLKTKFVIVANGRLSKRKSYYKKFMPYDEIVNLIVRSKAVLNVALENQKGITIRDMESMFFDVKLLTTNKNIVNTDIYNPNNVFVVDGLNIDGLPEFIALPHTPLTEEIKNRYTFDNYIKEIITSE